MDFGRSGNKWCDSIFGKYIHNEFEKSSASLNTACRQLADDFPCFVGAFIPGILASLAQ